MAENLVLSKLDSITASPLNLVLDKYPTTAFTAASVVRYYWRFEDEPTSPFQFLGQQTVGFDFQTSFDPMGREIRISQIGISAAGVASATDPRAGVQTVLTPDPTYGLVTHLGEVVTHEGNVVEYNG